MLLIAAVGVMADKRPIAAAARAPNVRCGRIAGDIAGGVAFAASSSLVERGLVGVLGFVNLVNFTDGLDWMTVVEVVPITAALGTPGSLGILPWQPTIISLALYGATIGFAFFNRPVAKLFLGGVGSLPIGLLLGWLLLVLASAGWYVAAVLRAGSTASRGD